MTAAEFQTQIKQTGCYDTPPSPPAAWCDRLLGRFDVWYNLRVCSMIIRAFFSLVRGRPSSAVWFEHSIRITRIVEACGGRVSIRGAHHLACENAPVIVSNHMSALETLLLPSAIVTFHDMTTVVKDSLLNYPLFSRILRTVKAIGVTRTDPRKDLATVLSQGPQVLKEDRALLLFPQGTRSREFDASRFNSLGVKLAKRAGVSLIPLAVKTDFHGVGRWVKDFGPVDRSQHIHLAFGAPLTVDVDGNAREVHQKAVSFIADQLRAWDIPVVNGPDPQPTTTTKEEAP